MAAVAPMETKPSSSRRMGKIAISTVSIGGVLFLGVLIVRELLPHHSAPHASSRAEEPSSDAVEPAPTQAPPRAAPRAKVAEAPAPAQAAAAPTAAAVNVPLAATLISQVVTNPEAFAPSNTFAPPVAKTEMFHYEQLPPFNSTELRRSRANPKAWELSALRGPKMEDLGPPGGVKEAAIVKDDMGNQTSWFQVDKGPLAGAFAVTTNMGVRVISHDYVEEHRAEFPEGVASLLDK
jgi:hypothetical protein